jgi:hypothetical protein
MAYVAKTRGDRKPEYSIFINRPLALALIVLIIVGGVLKLLI